MTNLYSIFKNRDITLPIKVRRQGYGFSSGHVWMWELDCESWAPKNRCFGVFLVFSFIFISSRLITSQHFSGFCHTLTWISHGVTFIPHPENWCFWTMMLEKTLESPLDCKEIQPIHPKGDQSWVFIGRTNAEAETPILWPPHAKSWLIGKDPDAGRDWGQEEKGTTEDKMVGWHHRLDGHGFE